MPVPGVSNDTINVVPQGFVPRQKQAEVKHSSGSVFDNAQQPNANSGSVAPKFYDKDKRSPEQKSIDRSETDLDKLSYWGIDERLTSDGTITYTNENIQDKGRVYKAKTEFKGGKLVEKTYLLTKEGKFVEVENGSVVSGATTLSPSQLVREINDAEHQLEEKDKNKGMTYNKFKEDGYYNGKTVYNTLKGYTDNRYYNKINKALDNIGEDNVVEFLSDYYKASGYKGKTGWFMKALEICYGYDFNSGLLEQLDSEMDSSGELDMTSKRHVVDALLAKAESCGLKGSDAYQQIVDVLDWYNEGEYYADADNFRGNSWKGSFWRNRVVFGGLLPLAFLNLPNMIVNGVAAIFGHGGYVEADSEKLDAAMYQLHQEILKAQKEAEQEE